MINEAFGTDDYPTLADKISSGATDSHLPAFLDSWAQWALDWASPDAQPHSIRPYALSNWKGDPTSGLSGLWQKGAGGASGSGGSSGLYEQFIRHLLYCDAIALPDLLFGQGALTPALRYFPEISIEIKRVSITEVIARLAPFAQLIENDLLIVVPYADEPDLPGYLLSDLATVANTVNAEFPQMPTGWEGEITYAQRAAIDLAAQIVIGKGDFDAYLPTPVHVHLFRTLCGKADAVLAGVAGTPLPENRLFWRLLDCELPDLVNLPLKDVVAIRQAGEFELWRKAVTNGLIQVEALTGHDDNWPGISAATKQEIAASVQEAANAAGKSLKSTDKKVKAGIDMVSIGGGIAATFLLPPFSTILAGVPALGLLCHALVRWRLGRPGSFARHVAVFGNATQ